MIGQNLAPSRRLVPKLGGEAWKRDLQELLQRFLQASRHEKLILKIPHPVRLMQRNPGMHYHFRPEIFIQVQGATRFRFSGEEMLLSPGEMAVLPAGLAHAETALAGDGVPFRNLVIGFYSNSVSMHFAADQGGGKPDIETIAFFSTPDLQRLIEMVDYLVKLHHSSLPNGQAAVHGLAQALLAVLADLSHVETPEGKQESQRIFQVKWMVRDQIYNPELNVTFMAQHLGCSADYLSHIFHKATGETLIHYIHRQRITGALAVLAGSTLSVSEIAWACGFTDAGYFTRVFRKHTGMTPQAYRLKRGQEAQSDESLPKTIYHDRADYSPGVPATSSRKTSR